METIRNNRSDMLISLKTVRALNNKKALRWNLWENKKRRNKSIKNYLFRRWKKLWRWTTSEFMNNLSILTLWEKAIVPPINLEVCFLAWGNLFLCRIELESHEYDFLEAVYANESEKSKVNWHNFVKDINLVFAEDVRFFMAGIGKRPPEINTKIRNPEIPQSQYYFILKWRGKINEFTGQIRLICFLE